MIQLTGDPRRFAAGIKKACAAMQKFSDAYEAATPLTAKQQAVLDFVVDYIAKHNGHSPTYREIGRYFEIAPKNARQHIRALACKGVLSYTEGTARSIVVGGNKSYPLGEPEDAVE